MLVHGLGDPVDSGVISDGVVEGINADDLVVLVCAVLRNPVGVQDSEVADFSAYSLLGDGAEVAGWL